MNINYELSDKMHDLIYKAIRSNASKKGFGVFPTEKQFLKGIDTKYKDVKVFDNLAQFVDSL